MQKLFSRGQNWQMYTLLLHGIGWIGYLTVMVLLWRLGAVDSNPVSLLRFFVTVCLFLPGLFYINTLVLIPRFFQTRQWTNWFAAHAVLTVVIVIAECLFTVLPGTMSLPDAIGPALLTGAGWVFVMTSIAFIYRYLIDGIAMPLRLERLQAEKDAADLAFLKSQVDPHFLFNTLNTLYALSLKENATQTANSIALLGRLMRYSLHDAQTETISLMKELQYLETYVDLQRLRAMPHATITFEVAIPDETQQAHHIAPMLLIPFVENAFKYGLHPSKPTIIQITMSLEEGTLTMQCVNSVARAGDEVHSGHLGVSNARQRLDRLYPDTYMLQVGQDEGTYSVNLEVNL